MTRNELFKIYFCMKIDTLVNQSPECVSFNIDIIMTIGNHPHTPIDTIQNLRATCVSREISVNVLLLLKVSRKPLRSNSTEAEDR